MLAVYYFNFINLHKINEDMKTSEPKKKFWVKPEVHLLNIKKDTFSGKSYGPNEVQGKSKMPTP